jgi:hypothetical protein
MNLPGVAQLSVTAGFIFVLLAAMGVLKVTRWGLQLKLTRLMRMFLGGLGILLLVLGVAIQLGASPRPCNGGQAEPSKSKLKSVVRVSDAFYPGGWMGDYGDVSLDVSSAEQLHDGKPVVKIGYSAAASQGKGWSGIYWLYPDGNWGSSADARNLTGARRVHFWAKGAKGDERAEFKVGGIAGEHPDSVQPPVSTGTVVLTTEWKEFTIDLSGRDLSQVRGGFCWVTSKQANPKGATIYLVDVQYEP